MIVEVARLAVWEWYKLQRRWMPYVLVGVAVLLTQLLLWLGYSAYHNDTMQAVFSGGSSSFGYSTEVDGEVVEVSVSCIDLVNGRMPASIDQLPEDQRQELSGGHGKVPRPRAAPGRTLVTSSAPCS